MKDPASHGWCPEKLKAALDFAKASGSSALMVVEDGVIVGDTGDTAQKISSYSIRKSLISALYGIYSSEGVLDINQTLEQLGIDDNPPSLTEDEKQARIVDLLRARGRISSRRFRNSIHDQNTPAAGKPSAWKFLVLQQLGLQCSRDYLGKENRALDWRSILPAHCSSYRYAGFQAGRCVLHGRADLNASRLPF